MRILKINDNKFMTQDLDYNTNYITLEQLIEVYDEHHDPMAHDFLESISAFIQYKPGTIFEI
jgi:peptide methionine sulfoxide reductase MsrA